MRDWAILLGGLAVWAGHFFALYGIASVLPGSRAAGALVLATTLAAIVAVGLVLHRALAMARAADPLGRWVAHVGTVGGAISLIAIVWQAGPALFA